MEPQSYEQEIETRRLTRALLKDAYV